MSDKNIVNELVEELSRINSAAADYAENAENAKVRLGHEYRRLKENFDEDLNEEAKKRLEALKEKLTAENAQKIEALHEENEEYMKALEKAFEENHSKWAGEIADEITSERL